MNKFAKFLSLALLSSALVQQVFAQGQYAQNNNPSDGFSYADQNAGRPGNAGRSVNAGQRGNIVNDPDNVEPFSAPEGRFEERNSEFRKYTERQCPGAMHFTQPNHPSMGPGSERQSMGPGNERQSMGPRSERQSMGPGSERQ